MSGAILDVINIGIGLRDADDLTGAETVFTDAIKRFPDAPYGWQELGVLRARQGAMAVALDLFRRAVALAPHDPVPRKHLVQHLLGLEQFDEAVRAAACDPPPPEAAQRAQLAALADLARFVRAYPKAWALATISRFEEGHRYATPEAVRRAVLDAVARRAPFALIRLGDGEGAWLSLDAKDEAAYPHLYEQNRRRMLRIWFNSERLYDSNYFRATVARVNAVARHVDIVGIPYGLRIMHEYRAGSATGIAGCVNILRATAARPKAFAATRFCSHDIHQILHARGFFRELLVGGGSHGGQSDGVVAGLVTCHPDLGGRLAERWGARIAHVVLVPEELGFTQVVDGLSPITGVSGIAEPHFPAAFQRITAKLARVTPLAAVWLVAAGYLGKHYCGVIRQHGGIALDVGSIADGWAGRVTRPYLADLGRFAL